MPTPHLFVTAAGSDAGTRRSSKPDAEEHEEVVRHPGSVTGSCGVERWSVKTGTDADAGLIRLQSTTQSTIAALGAFGGAGRPAGEQPGAALVEYKLEADSDYHLVLTDGSPTPTPATPSTPLTCPATRARPFTVSFTGSEDYTSPTSFVLDDTALTTT